MRIVGTVVGQTGAPVAGWVTLGKGAPRRWHGERFVVGTADGEVEVALGQATIEPAEQLRAPWGAIETDPLVAPCRADAPGPHVEVSVTAQVVRGGDRVALWAPAGAAPRVAERVARGEAAVALLERMLVAAATPARGEAAAGGGRRSRDPQWRDRCGIDLVTPLALVAAMVLGALGVNLVPGSWRLDLLVIGCLVLAMPAMVDIAQLGFRVVGAPFNPAALDPALRRALLLVLALASAGFMLLSNTAAADERQHVANQIFLTIGLGGSHILLAATAWSTFTTGRRRRRLLRIVTWTRAHAVPPKPGVWGALDGRAVALPGVEAPLVGDTGVLVVQGKRWRLDGGGEQASWDSSLAAAVESFRVEAARGAAVTVQTAKALWCSTVTLGQRTGDHSAEGGDVIADGSAVRVIGRPHDGVFAAGGEESLLLWAVPAGQRPGRVAGRLLRRSVTAVVLLALACLGLVATTGLLAL